ncbi:hypothetical protein KW807_01310 [Candidatus Parcubacteria bacterium]|nr:hypothetical protein [Candidatus Parcubacteria bacterium]
MKKVILAALAFAPTLAFAQTEGNLGNIQRLIESVGRLINTALPIVVALGLLAFFWGLVRFIFGAEEKKSEGKHIMIWGIVALFVMVSVWGLVRFIGSALGINQVNSVTVPTVDRLP